MDEQPRSRDRDDPRRIWPALVDLDEVTFDRLTGPTIAVLAAMPPGVTTRSSLAEVVVLRRAG
jgi:hypothetical protein